jgi:Reverse transcriptase (RNA-dependent DNA polymerase)
MSLALQIAQSLQLSEDYVQGAASSASHRYKQFTIKKADRISNRLIEQPSKALKLLQRWLVKRVFDPLPTHPCAHAYVKGRSIATNAAAHREGRYISRLDFENFFPSLTSRDIELLLTRNPILVGGSVLMEEDFRLVCQLVCRFGRLTIGAPSSPTISNKLLYDIDSQLARLATEHNAGYTRYADDLYFSSSQSGVLYVVCKEAERVVADTTSPKLVINNKKTYHGSRKKRMVVTGLRITPQAQVSVGRELKRKIRVFAHKARNTTLGPEDLSWLRGMLAYISSIEPEYARRIRSKYEIR